MRTLSRVLWDQRGIALPMALIIILILSALTAAFSVLGASEPTLAANQQRVAQARAIAESGLERAIWALNNPGDANGIQGDGNGILPNPNGPASAPYDGSVLIPTSLAGGAQVGGFRVTVTASKDALGVVIPNERSITVDGWVPNDTAAARVKQRIQVTVTKLRNFAGDAPAALTVRGELDVGGHSLIDSRSDGTCGHKAGSWSEGATSQGGSSNVYGYGDNTANSQVLYANNPSGDIVTQVPDAKFNAFTYTSDELNMLKAIAKSQGTYYQGSVTFNASNKVPNGVVFIDTVSGNNITASTPISDFASLKISGNAPASADGIFHGWMIVNGSATIDGTMEIHGFLYVVNDLSYKGTGTGKIMGAVISQNIRDTSSTSIDSDTGGNSTIIYNCAYAKNGDGGAPISMSFAIKGGTYKQVAG
jgi:hypothetical protein